VSVGGGRQGLALSVSLVNAARISFEMVEYQRAITALRRFQNVGFACNSIGGGNLLGHA
jgi:hypothetical protein